MAAFREIIFNTVSIWVQPALLMHVCTVRVRYTLYTLDVFETFAERKHMLLRRRITLAHNCDCRGRKETTNAIPGNKELRSQALAL